MKKLTGKKVEKIEAPYSGIALKDYNIEKRRLQLELLTIQQKVAKRGQRVCICFDGRDAAGKGSTILRHTQNLMPKYYKIVDLGIPTKKESKYWFRRYEQHLPREGEIVFFDRSWYNRALIEPTMGYCTQSQYEYFMHKVLEWEHNLIDNGLKLIKFYLSVDPEHQLYRFQERLSDPLKFWKFSENDFHARKKWETFTKYKEQMFNYTASKKSPWILINANHRKESRLTTMLYLLRAFGNKKYVPLTGQDVSETFTVQVNGVAFRGLNKLQMSILSELVDSEHPELGDAKLELLNPLKSITNK
ncbi:MAG: polyphosphate kinase [Thermodesulfobacteriota bacterium]